MLSMRVTTDGEFRRAALALREEDARFPTELRRTVLRTVRPYVQRVKANVRAIPVFGTRHTGLRRRVALGVSAKARTNRSPGITIQTAMMDPSEAAIPRGLDRREGWRHPVFGNTDSWVRQTTGGSWFRETLAGSQGELRHEIVDEINAMLNRVGRAA